MTEREPQVRGGLQLPKNMGISDHEQQQVKKGWDTIGDVESNLSSKGFIEGDKPPFPRPTITAEQLTTVINKDYTLLYAQHLAWYNYTSPILAKIKARLLQSKNHRKHLESKLRKELRSKNRMLPREDRLNEKDIEDEIWGDEEYRTTVKWEQQYEQTKLELESYLDITENTLRVISRQVEIRKLELNGSDVEDNMPGRGRFRSPRTP